MSKVKKNLYAKEIGQLKAALANRERSIEHYRALVGAHSKTMHRQARALSRLRTVARALLDENTDVAKASFKEPSEPWSDEMWKRGDALNARLCIALRRELEAE